MHAEDREVAPIRAAALGVVVGLPLVVAVVAFRWRPWYPVLDMAMTEFRVRDVGGRHTPLIGLPGRIGDFPDQGSHPGPLSFYLLAPFYRLGGSSSWAMQLGAVAVNLVALAGIVVLWARRAGWLGVAVGASVGAVLVRGYGIDLLTHPWNPYLPLLVWALVLVATWSVVDGDRWAAPVVVAAATVCAQTHVPYLPLAVVMVAMALSWLAAAAWRAGGDERRGNVRALAWSMAVGVVLWLPPLVDQWRRDPGNIKMLLDHFATPGEDPIGVGTGVRVFLGHLDAPSALAGLVWRSDRFVELSSRSEAPVLGGLVTLAVFAAAVVYAARHRMTRVLRLHAVVGVALLVGLVSMTRIFGKIWYYLTLWAWATLTLLLVAVAWTVWSAWHSRREASSDGAGEAAAQTRSVLVASGAVVAVATLLSAGAAIRAEVPEPMLSKGLGMVVEPTVEAVAAGVGDAVGLDGTYVVFWQDSVFIGAQGYGLVNELERRGLDVGVHPTWRVPVTPQRVLLPGQNDAEIHLVSGVFIEQWRARPGLVEVVEIDARSQPQRERFEELRADVIAELTAIGRDDLIPVVEVNLFGASLDPDLPDRVRLDMSEMLLLGEPVAIFIAPAGTTE